MGFGNDDPIDARHRARIRELEAALAAAAIALERSTGLTQREKDDAVRAARATLGDGPVSPAAAPTGAFV